MKIGITGQIGFIGSHLSNTLRYFRNDHEVVPFEDRYFENLDEMDAFVRDCDVIIHLAAMNRHGEPQVIYDTNLRLVTALIASLRRTNRKSHLIFSSSTQEERDNAYGRSKKEGRKLLEAWASENGGRCSALLIPNVFGPFGKPHYNSVISTFSYQLTHGVDPKIEIDAALKLIYVNDLVKNIIGLIDGKDSRIRTIPIDHTAEVKVSEILGTLCRYKEQYLDNHTIPVMHTPFDVALFNTFRSYIDSDTLCLKLTVHTDNRGHLFESIKTHAGGQVFFSVTEPGVTRGNHFHTRKIERFCVVRGEALIKIRKIGTGTINEYRVSGADPSFIDMPVWHTHNITNIGSDGLETLFWSNEIFNPSDSDTFAETV